MTIDLEPTLKPQTLREALADARTLVASEWLEAERRKRPRDRVLVDPEKAFLSPGQVMHALKYGAMDDPIHPVAECLIAAEVALEEYDRNRAGLVSPLFYRVLSLRDIARARHSVQGIEPRIRRLTGPDWRSTLYELIVACSYRPALKVEFLPESDSPVPDIALHTDPVTYVECKTRLEYEHEVVEFVNTWQRESLATIKRTLLQYKGSFLVRVIIISPQTQDTYRTEIPRLMEEMVRKGIREIRFNDRFSIVIEPREDELTILPEPISPVDRELWRIVLDFDEWGSWHDVSPDGEVRLLKDDQRLAGAVGKRCLVCIRAEYLRDNRVSLLNALKDACKRQFRDYQPGIAHVLVDASLFGLGDLQRPEVIQKVLGPEVDELFRSYTRVWKVFIDLMSEPEGKFFKVQSHRLVGTNPRFHDSPKNYADPLRYFLV